MNPNNIFFGTRFVVQKNKDGLWVFFVRISSLVDIPAGSAS
jgi:hypothetical protein